ncbi:MAG TPA: hypothetical protein VF876_16760 [Burkholderiales bacterium]
MLGPFHFSARSQFVATRFTALDRKAGLLGGEIGMKAIDLACLAAAG